MKRFILAVDPGKQTGICLFSYESNTEPVLMWSGEYTEETFAGMVRQAIMEARAEGVALEVACERFTITAQTAKNSQAPYSLEQIGVLKHLIRESDGVANQLVYQGPVDAKRLFPNEALKKLEYWHRGGEGHALDAIRHGLLYLAKHGWTPKRLLQ
jgi:hypothetical protein